MENMDDTTTIGAEELINRTVDEADSAEEIIDELKVGKEKMEASEAATVQSFIDGVRPQIKDTFVKPLQPGIGGLYDGEITIAQDSLIVDESVKTTVARLKEIKYHETYHLKHDHLAPMIAGDSAEGDTVVTIGGTEFNDTELIEGMTVAQTGEEFVSEDYKNYKADLLAAVGKAGIDLSDVEEAIDEGDLRQVDDATMVKGGKNTGRPSPILAA